MRERRKDNVTMPPPSQLLLADTEVAALLGIGVSTVWKKAKDQTDCFPKPFSTLIEQSDGAAQMSSNGSKDLAVTRLRRQSNYLCKLDEDSIQDGTTQDKIR